ncbi:hypothetical protein BH10ACT7_BH10ACT7_16160 [soil metagenome]
MGEYGRQLLDFVVILATPAVSPHLDALAVTVLFVLLVAVSAVVVLRFVVLSAVGMPAVAVLATRYPRLLGGRRVRGAVRARAPSWTGIRTRS